MAFHSCVRSYKQITTTYLSSLSSLSSLSLLSNGQERREGERGERRERRSLSTKCLLKDDFSLLRQLPKAELHAHLDGCLRLPTLIDLARENKVELPAYDPSGLMETVFKTEYESLVDYLRGFQYTVGVMQTEEGLTRVSYEMAIDNWNEGVRHLEVRFAPHLHMNNGLTPQQVIDAVNKGLEDASNEINNKIRPKMNDKGPKFTYGIILCFLRSIADPSGQGLSKYYQTILEKGQNASHASIELAQTLAQMKNREEYYEHEKEFPIVGIDLAGAEDGFPPSQHKEAYDLCNSLLIGRTVHAGEAFGPPSIFEAVSQLHTHRIGHGFHLFDVDQVHPEWSFKRKEKYIKDLLQYSHNRSLHFEVCLTSNRQTLPSLSCFSKHPLRTMIDHGLSASVCTDNTLMSQTTITKEHSLAISYLDLTMGELKRVILNGFESGFYSFLSLTDRLKYLESVSSFFDEIVSQNEQKN